MSQWGYEDGTVDLTALHDNIVEVLELNGPETKEILKNITGYYFRISATLHLSLFTQGSPIPREATEGKAISTKAGNRKGPTPQTCRRHQEKA